MLDRVRLCRELLQGRPEDESARGLTLAEATRLDHDICRAIHGRVGIEPPRGLDPYIAFAAWARSITRAYPLEVFTTNYDLLIERGLEAAEVPYFDGFIGSYEPYFSAASVDADLGTSAADLTPPRGWVRVWKLHGSIGWCERRDAAGRVRIVRATYGTQPGGTAAPPSADELLIYPSRQKYEDSRKRPYVAFHDRLRRILVSGETLLVTAGYSFGDQHINEIIFEGLRANNRLAVTALIFGDLQKSTREQLLVPTSGCLNLTMYAANSASISGIVGTWSAPGPAPAEYGSWPFWDVAKDRFTLGDFSGFAGYLRSFLGVREQAQADALGTTAALGSGHIAGAASGTGHLNAAPAAPPGYVPTPSGAAISDPEVPVPSVTSLPEFRTKVAE